MTRLFASRMAPFFDRGHAQQNRPNSKKRPGRNESSRTVWRRDSRRPRVNARCRPSMPAPGAGQHPGYPWTNPHAVAHAPETTPVQSLETSSLSPHTNQSNKHVSVAAKPASCGNRLREAERRGLLMVACAARHPCTDHRAHAQRKSTNYFPRLTH